MIISLLFWIAFCALIYIYLGYPFLVFIISHVWPRPVRRSAYEPSVTVLIAAFNEADVIERTIQNKLALDYPPEKLQVIVVSDGSTDGTDAIVSRYTSKRLLLLRQQPRNGKSAALNVGAAHATGDILVFADANSIYKPDALRRLVVDFADPDVGYASGKLIYSHSPGNMTGDGCSLYMRYENFIRERETLLGSVVGVNGGIDAIRKRLYASVRPDQLPDLFLPLHVVESGFRVVYEPQAVAYELALDSAADEYRMRVRVALRSLWVLDDMAGLLKFWRYGLYSVQLLSHKVLRYLAFAFIVVLACATPALWSVGPLFQAASLLQALLIGSALLGALEEHRHHHHSLLYVPYYFLLVNCAATAAFFRFLGGDRPHLWRPRLG
jgi:cellulose synthase/poly-beta-1,6-N-acetylglucosamine synthase-like glycosyltransferase